MCIRDSADADAWENNRMQTSGVGGPRILDENPDAEEVNRVHLLVHDLKPPFLDGKIVYTKQVAPVNPVRDPNSDLATFAIKGSRLVKEHRERAERQKAARRVASLKGTQLGNIMGVKNDDEDETEGKQKSEIDPATEDGKGDSKFAQHLKNIRASSKFSQEKSLREQRQYLPALSLIHI